MLKKFYNGFLSLIDKFYNKVVLFKITMAEVIAIIHKRKFYKNVKWTKEQQASFDEYWKKNYGKKISNKWHRLYESMSGSFCIEYIPEMMYSIKIEPKLNDRKYAAALEDKSMVENLCVGTGAVVPETVLVCIEGNYFDKNRDCITKEKAIEIFSDSEKVIFKPIINSSSGKNIRFFDEKVGEKAKEILDGFGKNFMIQKQIIPHEAFKKLNPTSINTIRIVTYIINGKIDCFPVTVRIGRDTSRIDNIHAGGISIGVDDNGRLLKKGSVLAYGDKNIPYSKHPDTGVVFENYELPKIAEAIEVAKRIHTRYSRIGIVSWDFTIDKDENIVLIESNIMGQSIWFPQILHGTGAFGKNTPEILQKIRK